ncbi:MAG: fumarylacetoacetate hydrolase family protein [Tannerella sp.]|jgi:2-keto-4-pentenoate hydratase/2-oxohepta-3-ene-1,7-dioic acid hydratase in catechol pathway|nr:fumarylacetoacetate hydrolase family protein [Tannerella sp.]
MKIIAVGMNYTDHNREMNNPLLPKEPVIFMKGDSALLKDGKPFFIPDFASCTDFADFTDSPDFANFANVETEHAPSPPSLSSSHPSLSPSHLSPPSLSSSPPSKFKSEIHHEVEIVVKINRLGKNIAEQFAYRYYDEITAGIDFTARDLQRRLRSQGHPWELSKAFDGSAVIGDFIPLTEVGSEIQNIDFHLDIDGVTVQHGNTRDMLFSVDKIIAYVSRFFSLKMGDLIYTGTPSGVGPVAIGNHLQAYIGNRRLLDFHVR